MSGCSCESNAAFDGMSPAYKKVLWWIIAINFAMFLVEMFAGVTAHSQALFADALDFLGDSLTYFISLVVIAHSIRVRAKAAMFKGITLALMGSWVLLSTLYRFFVSATPEAFTMGIIGFMALAANVLSVLLLLKYKDGDANVRSVWLCSRNDAIGNIMIIVAASGVWVTQSGLPDVIIAFIMASLFLHSSWLIIRQARQELRQADQCDLPKEF